MSKPLLLVLDTETTGFVNKSISWTDAKQVRCCEVAAQLVTTTGRTVHTLQSIIRCDGWEIPEFLIKLHGISTEMAVAHGRSMGVVLEELAWMIDEASWWVGHNSQYDLDIVEIMFRRWALENGNPLSYERWYGLPRYCTMHASVAWCNLPPTPKMIARGMHHMKKQPSLMELHEKCFGVGFDEAHGALSDVIACRRAFFHLVSLGEITPPWPVEEPPAPEPELEQPTEPVSVELAALSPQAQAGVLGAKLDDEIKY